MITLKLPLPPSLNAAYSNVPGKGRVATAALRQWKGEAGWRLKEQRPPTITGQYHFTIYLPMKMRGDVSNRIKNAEDLLVTHGVTPDDKHAMSVTACRSDEIGAGQCVVHVESAA